MDGLSAPEAQAVFAAVAIHDDLFRLVLPDLLRHCRFLLLRRQELSVRLQRLEGFRRERRAFSVGGIVQPYAAKFRVGAVLFRLDDLEFIFCSA